MRRGDRGALHAALAELAEQDPLINLRQDDTVSLFGEVQKEVIGATLAERYGRAVRFLPTTTVCAERPVGDGAAYELIGVDPNPFLATRPGDGRRRGWRPPAPAAGPGPTRAGHEAFRRPISGATKRQP